MTPSTPRWLALIVMGALCCGACSDEAAGKALWDRLKAEDFRNAYRRPPGWTTPRSPRAGGPHGGFVDVYVNSVMAAAIDAGVPIDAWPEGSVAVKEGWATADAAKPEFLLAMERGDDGWFWAEWQGDGTLVVAGDDVAQCVACHDAGEDQVRAIDLPPL